MAVDPTLPRYGTDLLQLRRLPISIFSFAFFVYYCGPTPLNRL